MQKSHYLPKNIRIVDIQVNRLAIAYKRLSPLAPFTQKKINSCSDIDIAFLDMLSTRFGKSQDLISRTIFPILFDQFLPTQEGTFIDHLNYLEKVRVIDDAQWWFEIRDIRNSLTHEYFDDAGIIAGAVNKLLEETPKLIAFWEELKPKVEALLR